MPPTENLGDEEIQEYFKKCKEKLGFVPNVLRAYSHNMKRLKNFINLYNELMAGDSTLSKVAWTLITIALTIISIRITITITITHYKHPHHDHDGLTDCFVA